MARKIAKAPRRWSPLAPVLLAAAFAQAGGAAERDAVAAAAARLGCEPARLVRLSLPHEGVWEAHCRDSRIVWLHRVDGRWTVKPIGRRQSARRRRRSALPITETELRLIAAAAIMGSSRTPNAG